MSTTNEEGPAPPEPIAVEYADWRWRVVSSYPPDAVTYRLRSGSGEERFLKLQRPGQHPSLRAEAERTRWAVRHLPVPTVLDEASQDGVSWMVTQAIRGDDATAVRWRTDVGRLVRALAEGLRAFHEASADDCPFDFRLERALAHARRRVERGEVDPARDFHAEFEGMSAEGALERLEDTRPTEERIVICHGDYCPPNVLIEDWVAVGFVDLGELGVADRWWDLAVASWAVGWNFGPGYEDAFLAAYGVAPDSERLAFYRLLYDLVS